MQTSTPQHRENQRIRLHTSKANVLSVLWNLALLGLVEEGCRAACRQLPEEPAEVGEPGLILGNGLWVLLLLDPGVQALERTLLTMRTCTGMYIRLYIYLCISMYVTH